MPNTKVIEGLNNANKVSDIYAYLVDENSKSVFTFLYNPEQKSFSRTANYDEGITALNSISSQYYKHTTGLTLGLSNLILETYNQGKSCKLLLQRLQSLMVADPSKGQYTPSPVYFKWGTDSFGPAVITNISWTETSWLTGEVASARVNLTLLEIPESQLPNKAKIESSENRLQAALNKSKVLTDRQKDEGLAKAKTWLIQNRKKLRDDISNSVNSNKYKLTIYSQESTMGVINIFTDKGGVLGTVGTYKDGKLDTSKTTLLKKVN
ncbi:hypothetical protein [Nostoc sp. UHCC 0870]|uniref:hypothetical protein n=1 Tax=Nostoc sp. UHCC 0870 TaxID=2914041 RepID=UPI001EDDCED1|nr:hypothetical protein [Nostoc sp. UHCC 0870]UKO99360.1 hypothetical protein L6494_06505 [Nostoc sp. UHCC 0870]